jgi:hypothetical protein
LEEARWYSMAWESLRSEKTMITLEALDKRVQLLKRMMSEMSSRFGGASDPRGTDPEQQSLSKQSPACTIICILLVVAGSATFVFQTDSHVWRATLSSPPAEPRFPRSLAQFTSLGFGRSTLRPWAPGSPMQIYASPSGVARSHSGSTLGPQLQWRVICCLQSIPQFMRSCGGLPGIAESVFL